VSLNLLPSLTHILTDSPTYVFLYQLALRTPGISPWSANLRKQMRQMPNLRYTARGRPQSRQRFSWRELNFGVAFALAIFDLLATEVGILVWAVGFRRSAVGQTANSLSFWPTADS
jgi:hypothetical protein